MARGKRIPQWLRCVVAEEALRNRREPREAVAVRIETYLEARSEMAPQRDTLLKMISEFRRQTDPLDRPWSVSSLPNFEIPADALPKVMEAWAYQIRNDSSLTVREVRWIARLHQVLKHRDLGILIGAAHIHASREKADESVASQSDKEEDMWRRWLDDATLYRAMTNYDDVLMKCARQLAYLKNDPHWGIPDWLAEEGQDGGVDEGEHKAER
jgi:hypothetical protein